MWNAGGGPGFNVRQREAAQAAGPAVGEAIDRLLALGHPLTEIPTLIQSEVERRLQGRAGVLVLHLQEDPGIGEMLVRELEGSLGLAVQPLAIEALAANPLPPQTLVTTRFLLTQAQQALGDRPGRLVPLDIYDYQAELQIVREMPPQSRLGLVSPSKGALRMAATIVHSERPDLLVSTVLPQDTYRLQHIARQSHTIIVGHGGEVELSAAVRAVRGERTRPLRLLRCDRYVAPASLRQLKVELGLS
ncbi:MAG: GntR family transcriptional regulator [Oscillatoriales cyanobacterium SM2_1_8]|nr:GntR family transcriptional regulator [Oscillatoriales cyanobacterium SM2_1_8]